MSLWERTKPCVRKPPLWAFRSGRTIVTERDSQTDAPGHSIAKLLHEIAEGLQSTSSYVAAARHETPGSGNLPVERLRTLAKALEQIARTNDAFARLKTSLAPVLIKLRGED